MQMFNYRMATIMRAPTAYEDFNPALRSGATLPVLIGNESVEAQMWIKGSLQTIRCIRCPNCFLLPFILLTFPVFVCDTDQNTNGISCLIKFFHLCFDRFGIESRRPVGRNGMRSRHWKGKESIADANGSTPEISTTVFLERVFISCA
jgi:hypothetical protein